MSLYTLVLFRRSSFLFSVGAFVLCSLPSCSKDDSPAPADDALPASEQVDTLSQRDEAIDFLLADGESLAVTGKAYNVTSTTASVTVRFNAAPERLKSSQLVLLLTDSPTRPLQFGKGCTEIYIKSDWLDARGIAVIYVKNLIPASEYRYRLFYRYNSYESALGDELTMKTAEASELSAEAVNLGLSVKWSSWNLGAFRSYHAGRFYLYGQVGSWAPNACSTVGNDQLSDPVSVELPDGWQSPTMRQCLELINECTWAAGAENGVQGFFVYGKGDYSENYIFIPSAGYVNANGVSTDAGKGFMLWSCEMSDSPDKAYAIKSNPDGTFSVVRATLGSRLPIRPVFTK